MSQVKYNFYATLLDKYESYLNSSRIYNEFWGFSENTEKTESDFEKEQFQSLIDTINRVPFDSEPADKGTAFNEVVDCILENRKSDKMEIVSIKELNIIRATYKGRVFDFNIDLCKEFAKYFEGALTQQRLSGILQTKYGNVELYGYSDEIMDFKICDIKTTKQYKSFKYRDSWQRVVYPFCIQQQGIDISEFEFTITDFKNTYIETYIYDPNVDIPRLTNHVEGLIEFIELNKELITDLKIFNK